MASYEFVNHSNQVRDSCSSNLRHGCSKAQMCLNKILSIISSTPPYETSKESSLHPQIDDSEPRGNGNRGFDIDLNLRLGPWMDTLTQESESLAENGEFSACSFVGKVVESDSVAESVGVLAVEKSSEGECDPKEKPAQELAAEKAVEVSEITNQQGQSSEIDEETKPGGENGRDDEAVEAAPFEMEKHKSKTNDSLGLLVEAAKLISGNFGDDESDSEKAGPSRQEEELRSELGTRELSNSKRQKKNKKKNWRVADWYADLEDTSPVVRSKRGRSQVLPRRYMDSVLEPWKPSPRPQRSSTTAAATALSNSTRKGNPRPMR